jgi:6-phosphogluconolactonase/glucosamine-6-phosphate isomerase/deaminase
MSPDFRKIVNGHKVEQYYWSGYDVVYIDEWATPKKYDDITTANIEAALIEAKDNHLRLSASNTTHKDGGEEK